MQSRNGCSRNSGSLPSLSDGVMSPDHVLLPPTSSHQEVGGHWFTSRVQVFWICWALLQNPTSSPLVCSLPALLVL